MKPVVKGIGFDLFGTLVLQKRFSFEQCVDALYTSLRTSGFALDKETFVPTYRQVNRRFMDQTMADGRETHNRLWVAGALQTLGYAVDPSDGRVEAAIEAYFEPFVRSCELIPGTYDMLASLAGQYRMGLVSNFTHPSAVEQILARVGLERFFDGIIISGRLGVRKPHPVIFSELARLLALAPDEIVFVGDELQTDIVGAQKAGMRTVWMTYRHQLERPSPLAQFLGMSEEAEAVHPHHVVTNWSEFVATLARELVGCYNAISSDTGELGDPPCPADGGEKRVQQD
jgi:putative hydrolase of the HAD superfamily